MAEKPSTLQDVARIAGVSSATVSRALSQPDMVSEATRLRVREAVHLSGYRVNRAARNLRTQRSYSVLVLLPDLGNPFFSTILAGISLRLSRRGYSMLIASTKHLRQSGERLSDYLEDRRADGMIVMDGGLGPQELAALEGAARAGQVLFACEWCEGPHFASVRSENRRGTAAAVRYLHGLGHRQIAHVTGALGNVLVQARATAFAQEMAALGLELPGDWVIPGGDFSLAAGCRAAHGWLALPQRTTAVFCASDLLAFGFISELSRHGVAVPGDVSVMGFDDIELAAQFIPPLTTMRQDRQRLGETAAAMLLDHLEAPAQREPQQAVVPVSLVVRQSTRAIKA